MAQKQEHYSCKTKQGGEPAMKNQQKNNQNNNKKNDQRNEQKKDQSFRNERKEDLR